VDLNVAGSSVFDDASRLGLLRVKLSSALPYTLRGIKIAGALSLVGTSVAESVAGTAGAGSGLAYRILESGYRLNIPRMFAALILLSAAGVVIFLTLSLISYLLLHRRRWREAGRQSRTNELGR
jgi:NitT/TauT family transport system permease protein